MTAKKTAPKKAAESDDVKVIMTVSSWQHAAGETVTVDAATADRLVANGWARRP